MLPIQLGLLELILFEIQRRFSAQPYLQIMYKALFALGYYGLMRVGELTESPHAVKAANIHMATNKKKILIMLYSSKTHGMCDCPQMICITSNVQESYFRVKRNFAPFLVL